MTLFGTFARIAFGLSGIVMGYGLPATSLIAQAPDSRVVAPACSSLPPAIDSVRVVAVARLTATGKSAPIPPAYASLIIETLRTHFQTPGHVTLNIFQAEDSFYVRAIPYVGAHAYFTVRRGARPEKIAFGTGTRHQELHTALLSAIYAIHGDSLPPFPAGGKRLELELKVYTEPDTGNQIDALFRMTLPVYTIEKTPRLVEKTGLKYPYIAQQAGKGDSIAVDFVLGTDGRPIESTMDPVRGTYRVFALKSLKALPKMRYTPMFIGGCPVASYEQQRFHFGILEKKH